MTALSSAAAGAPVRIENLVRAAAILLVAFNHALDAAAANRVLNGGMSILLLVSGMSFARLALAGGTAERASRTLTNFAAKLLSATLAVVAITTPVRQTNIFTVSGFVYTFTELPFWYGAQMAVICVALALPFRIDAFARAFFRKPAHISLALLAAALAVHTVCEEIWDTHLMEHRLPHLLAWNFLLGWALYFLIHGKRRRVGLALVVAGASAAIGWGVKSDAAWLFAGALAVSAVATVRLPQGLAQAVNVVAQATFFIYLTSWIFVVGIADALHAKSAVGMPLRLAVTVVIVWAGAVAISVALWVLWTATGRAIRAICGPLRLLRRQSVPT